MPEASLLHGLKEFSSQNGLIRPSDSIVLAVSGGIDSMVMLDLLAQLRADWSLRLVIAHFNHQLRGQESDADEQFVGDRAAGYEIQCYFERGDVASSAASQHRSIQETARNLRYNFLSNLRASLGFQSIVTAHHADDNLETVLFHLFRGTGVHGLTGIPKIRRDLQVIRPLLFATRTQISEYATERNLPFREDSSNSKTGYVRNFIRHNIVPLIHDGVNPNITTTVSRTAELFQGLDEYLSSEIEKILPAIVRERSKETVVLDRGKFLDLPVFLQESALRDLVQEFARTEADFLTVKALINVSRSESGTAYPFPDNVVFYRDRDRLIFKYFREREEFCHPIATGQRYEFSGFSFSSIPADQPEINDNPLIEYIDAGKLGRELQIRNWRHGDRFIPLGMKVEKKLSDFFIDEKIPIYEKESIPLLESDGRIVWVCGRRLDERFKITRETQKFLKLEYTPKP